MLYTSRFFNPELQQNPDKYTVARISVGEPRFLKYKPVAWIKELAPFGLLEIKSKYEFRERYIERLEYYGVDWLKARFEILQERGKPVVLCCFEDVRKLGNNWCHRTMLADWFYEKTGERIPELPDLSPFKIELSDTPFTDLLKDFL